jgi:hypothetical protein
MLLETTLDIDTEINGDIDLEYVKLFHRVPECYVTFHLKPRDDSKWWTEMYAVLIGELAKHSVQIKDDLKEDSHFSINSFREAKHYAKRKRHGLPKPCRAVWNLRYLNACWVDLDLRKTNIDYATAFTRIHQLLDERQIPTPSIVTKSGTGLWLFWLLRDSNDPSLPVRAWNEKICEWKAIQKDLCLKFHYLSSDQDAIDASHTTRVSGSFRTTTGGIVRHSIQTVNGDVPRYTLNEITVSLGIKSRKPTPPPKKTLTHPNRGRGPKARWAKALRNFEKLCDIRKFNFGNADIKKGYGRAAWVYAVILKANGVTIKERRKHVIEFGHQAGFGQKQILSAIEHSKDFQIFRPGFGSITNQTIADKLKITPAESEQLESWPCATEFQSGKLPTPSRSELRAAVTRLRLAEIRKIIDQLGFTPSVRGMAELLKENGFKVSKSQVAKDYRKLGLTATKSLSEAMEVSFQEWSLSGFSTPSI